ncbi:hypothetical protein B0H17DRAFT_1130083 [Mycena rosella]|uniref:Uncharacterized protein n=1 Tax=Mycena rosella TaxID=1033263 RepID=A0AAD7DU28_MYCRO|nr:hypothetical protein B0H17DRAFT_1130083 [Mycena rosella]
MGVQENLLVYVDVVRHIEKLGGSKGHANNEEAFIKALNTAGEEEFLTFKKYSKTMQAGTLVTFPLPCSFFWIAVDQRKLVGVASGGRRVSHFPYRPVLKHAAKPREVGTPEDEKAGRQRSAFLSFCLIIVFITIDTQIHLVMELDREENAVEGERDIETEVLPKGSGLDIEPTLVLAMG